MIVGPTGAATMVIDRTWVSDSDNESVTFTVKLAVPVPVGVPEITPAELRERFVGSDPRSRLPASVPVPPEASRVRL